MKTYENLMRKCIKLAKKANGKNMPNPFVGAVIYDEKEDKIISGGYHKKYGQEHAEVNAINNACGNLKGHTLIVNLEPCSHFDKTPPCADLIIKSGIKKVVVAMADVNPIVRNNGIKKLQNANIEVILGVCQKEAEELNKVFIKNILQKKPYVMLKSAVTLDGKIALNNKKSKWITNEKSRYEVQKLRSSYQAIMSASGTILADNPNLNVRLNNKKSPQRIIFDPNNKIPLDYNVFRQDGVRIILINNQKIKTPKHIEQITFSGDFDELFKKLYEAGIYSIMVEAGCGFNSELFKAGEVDEVNIFYAPKIFGSSFGFTGGFDFQEIDECIEIKDMKIKQIEDNFLINGKIKNK